MKEENQPNLHVGFEPGPYLLDVETYRTITTVQILSANSLKFKL